MFSIRPTAARPRIVSMGTTVVVAMLAGTFLFPTASGRGEARASTGVSTLERYEMDRSHSAPTFKVRHFFSMVPGRFTEFEGVFMLDPEAPLNSTAEITIQAASIDTNNEKRDGHLRSADFFDAEAHPTITFRSTKVEATEAKDVYKVTGDMQMRGVTHPLVLDVRMLGIGPDGRGGQRAGYVATGTINRKDYGINWNQVLDHGGTMLGDEVFVEFPVALVQKDAQGS